jgi:hypothetical protein
LRFGEWFRLIRCDVLVCAMNKICLAVVKAAVMWMRVRSQKTFPNVFIYDLFIPRTAGKSLNSTKIPTQIRFKQ